MRVLVILVVLMAMAVSTQALFSITRRCHGKKYFTRSHACCNHKTIYLKRVLKCCPDGRVRLFCLPRGVCNGRYYLKLTHACCYGKTIYSKIRQRCCRGGRVTARRFPCRLPRCGLKSYNPILYKCCRPPPRYYIVRRGANCSLRG